MTVLDFIELNSELLDYRTVQKVWGEDAPISVRIENEDPRNPLAKEQKSLRGVIRPLGEKLKILEENRAAINSVIMSEGLEGFSEADLETLTFSWLLFVFSPDTGNCDLFIYFDHGCAALDGQQIAVAINNDDSITFEDIIEDD